LSPREITNPKNGMRGRPQQQPQQRIRQQVQHVPGSRQRRNRGPKKNRSGAQAQPVRNVVICARSNTYAYERKPVCRAENAALVFLLRNVLNQRADWHDKESAGETQPREQQQHRFKCQSRNRQAEPQQRHAQRAQRNQPVFDLSARKKSSCEAADADSNGYRSLKKPSVRGVQMQNILAVKENVELQ